MPTRADDELEIMRLLARLAHAVDDRDADATATASPTKSSALSRMLPRMKSGAPCPGRPMHAGQSSRCQRSTGPTTASATS